MCRGLGLRVWKFGGLGLKRRFLRLRGMGVDGVVIRLRTSLYVRHPKIGFSLKSAAKSAADSDPAMYLKP